SLGYPSRRGEIEMLSRQHYEHPLERLGQVATLEELRAAQDQVRRVYVDDLLKEYIVSLVEATRRHEDVYLGAGPRGSLALYNAARAWAAMQGRDYVIPDDIKELAEPTLAHRIIVNPAARMRHVDARAIVREVVASVPVPGARPLGGSSGETVTRRRIPFGGS
ncbi:MAG: MoxR family ATPase, partial [Thermomicrobium sp.]|nr:MoxR family ATPase [Thermomicrobium sp.]